MNTVRIGVLLFVLLVPVSCSNAFFTNPLVCYLLDVFLIVYCIVATVLFLKEKLSNIPPVAAVVPASYNGVHLALERPNDPPDAYLGLEQTKRRIKRAKKKKSPSNGAVEMHPVESLITRASASPLSP